MDGTRPGRRIALAWFAALLLFAPPASARHDFDPPADAPVVAGPTPSGARLVAFDHHRDLCVGTIRDDSGSFSCNGPPRGLRDFGLDGLFDGRRFVHAGVVPHYVAAVELVYADGERARTETTAGEAYTGRYAGRVRFFVLDGRRGNHDALYVRLLASDGSLLAAVSLAFEGAIVGRDAQLLRGQRRGARFPLVGFRRRGLVPLPGEPERLVDRTCVGLADPRDDWDLTVPRAAEACADPDRPSRALWVGTDSSCRGRGLVLTGLAATHVHRVEVLLGDGSRRRARLRGIPESLGPYRAFLIAPGRGVAVREIAAFDADGRRLERLELGLAPAIAECSAQGFFLFTFAPHLPPGPVHEPLSLVARDDGVLLCVGIGALRDDGLDCELPPVEPFARVVAGRASDGATLVAGVTPADVASVELEFADGSRTTVETTPDGPYQGRYQAHLRFFELRIASPAHVHAFWVLDAQGRRHGPFFGPDPPPFVRGPATVLRGPGGLRLSAALVRGFDGERSRPCLEVLARGERATPETCGFADPRFVTVQALCSPRRLVLWGLVPSGTRRVAVRTDRGVLRARTARLPTRIGSRRRAFLLVIPRGAAPRELVADRTERRLRLPAAARQCGYTTFTSLRR